jgi:hypothetical protein
MGRPGGREMREGVGLSLRMGALDQASTDVLYLSPSLGMWPRGAANLRSNTCEGGLPPEAASLPGELDSLKTDVDEELSYEENF